MGVRPSPFVEVHPQAFRNGFLRERDGPTCAHACVCVCAHSVTSESPYAVSCHTHAPLSTG